MKRIATWLRRVADEIDPPPKRGRKPRRAEKNAAAVDSLFDQARPHGWPQEPHWTDGPPPVF